MSMPVPIGIGTVKFGLLLVSKFSELGTFYFLVLLKAETRLLQDPTL
jgi:hypothetical protein